MELLPDIVRQQVQVTGPTKGELVRGSESERHAVGDPCGVLLKPGGADVARAVAACPDVGAGLEGEAGEVDRAAQVRRSSGRGGTGARRGWAESGQSTGASARVASLVMTASM